MPLYEYACARCGHRFEVRQGIREEPLTTCPECAGAIRRVIQPVGIVFKGSGFYKNDSRSTAGAAAPAAERSEAAQPAASNGKAAGEGAAAATPAAAPASSTSESSGAKAATPAPSQNPS
jgi:putative FmdB family regulatory protein